MKKSILLLCLNLFIASIAFSQTTNDDAKKDINKRAMKLARKDAKKYRKAGWDVSPGSLPLEKLLEKAYIKAELLNEKGNVKFIFADGNGVAQTKTAAELQALTFAKLALASQIESNVNALISGNVANQQIDNDDAESITQAVANSKELISAQLGYVEPTFKIYRTPKGNSENVEIQIRLFYDTEQSLQIAKRVIQKELKDKLKVNEDQLNKLMGID
jgi:hypothetical protein